MSALKDKTGKLPISEVPLSAVEAMQRGFEYGKKKYARFDWLGGHSAQDLIDAMLRHLMKMTWEGEIDQESGLSHMDHVLTNAAMYVEQSRRGVLRRDLLSQVPDNSNPDPHIISPASKTRTVECLDEKTGAIERMEVGIYEKERDCKSTRNIESVEADLTQHSGVLSSRQNPAGWTKIGASPARSQLGSGYCPRCGGPNRRRQDGANSYGCAVCGTSETEFHRYCSHESPC